MNPYQRSPPLHQRMMYQPYNSPPLRQGAMYQPQNSPPVIYETRVIPAQAYDVEEFIPMMRGPSHDSRRSTTSIASETRPGHFADLSRFARCAREGLNLEGIDPEPAAHAWLEPGMIVRVHDQLSRLNSRVMLIIRTHRSGSSMSMTCLSFCKHETQPNVSSGFAREHASVTDGHFETQVQNVPQRLTTLKVYIGRGALVSKVESGVWLNIREIWNVDLGVTVAILGHAERESFVSLLTKVKELFCETLGDADLGAPRARVPDSPRQRGAQMASRPNQSGGGERQERRVSFAERIAGRRPLMD